MSLQIMIAGSAIHTVLWLIFDIFLILNSYRAAIFHKVADLIAGKYRIQSLAATMVGQVRKSQY